MVLKQGLRGIAMNKKQCCPSLKNLVWWKRDAQYGICPGGYQAEVGKILDALYVLFFKTSCKRLLTRTMYSNLVSTFQEVGIRFDFTSGNPTKFGASNLMD
jgi:hypothetical protein